jgi:hypothetical protein
MSIAPTWCDFKTYCDTIGPDRGRPPRPAQCVCCDGQHVWFNGVAARADHTRGRRAGVSAGRLGAAATGAVRTSRVRPVVDVAAGLVVSAPQLRARRRGSRGARVLAHRVHELHRRGPGGRLCMGSRCGAGSAGSRGSRRRRRSWPRPRGSTRPGPIRRLCRPRCPPPRGPGRRRGRARWNGRRTSSSRSRCCIARSPSRRPIRARFAGGWSPSSWRSAGWRT